MYPVSNNGSNHATLFNGNFIGQFL